MDHPIAIHLILHWEGSKRILKSLLMNWHRVRRVVFGEPDANEYAKKKQELEVLKEQAAAEEIDLRYFDESGFSLNSNSPYAWQDKADRHAVKVGAVNRLMFSVLWIYMEN